MNKRRVKSHTIVYDIGLGGGVADAVFELYIAFLSYA